MMSLTPSGLLAILLIKDVTLGLGLKGELDFARQGKEKVCYSRYNSKYGCTKEKS